MSRLNAIVIAVGLLAAASARADVFVLSSGGEIRGEPIVSRDGSKGQTVIRTASGGEVTVDAKQVKQIVPQNAAEAEYDRIRPTYPDTVDGQWELAQWCLNHSLTKQRNVHLERIIALDSDHKLARAGLGYSFIDGRWLRPDDLKKEQGYVLYKGVWRLPQEVEIEEQRRKQQVAEREWFDKLKRWRAAVNARPDKAEQLSDDYFAKADGAAVPAVTQMLKNESVRGVKELLINELVKLGTAGALSTVVNTTLDDPDEEIRLSALDSLVATKHPEIVGIYVKALRSANNLTVNRAAYCLGLLKDKSAISPLIDALETTHKVVEGGGNPGQTSTTFGNGPGMSGGGLSVGGGPKVVKVKQQNQQVLKALVEISGQNFEWDQRAWKSWFASQKKPTTLDARRGE